MEQENTKTTPQQTELISPPPTNGQRFRKWTVAVLAGIFAWGCLVAGILAWRLTAGPIQFDWLTPRLEKALNVQSHDYAFAIGGTILTWSGTGNLIELQIKDFKVQTTTGVPVALFPTAGATFDWGALFRGKIALKGLSIKNPTFAIKRFKDGTFSITGGETAVEGSKNKNTQITPQKSPEPPPEKSNRENNTPIQTIVDETIKKQNINALMDILLLKSKSSYAWAKSLQFINVSNGRVIFIEDGHNFKWTIPDLNATLFRNQDDVTINAASTLSLTENFKDKANAKTIEQGNVSIALTSPNSDDISLKNKISMALDNIDVRFISQFLIPNTVRLTYDEHLDGKINLDLTQNWVPEIIDMDINSDLGSAKGDIVFLAGAGELSTNVAFKDIKIAKVIPLLPEKFPVASHITQIDSRVDATISTERFSLLGGGKITLDSTVHGGQFTLPKWFDAPVSYTTLSTKTLLDFALDVRNPSGNTVTLTTTPLATRINDNKTTVTLDTQYKFADFSSNTNVQVSFEDMQMQSLQQLWAKPLVPDVRDWVQKHLQQGQINATLKTHITHNKGITHVKSTSGDITVKGSSIINYYQTLPPITNVDANIQYDMEKMNVAFGKASIPNNTLDGSKITLFYKQSPTMRLNLKTVGDVGEILTLLKENTTALKDSPVGAQNLSGTVAGQAGFSLSLGEKSIPLNPNIKLTGESLTLKKPEWYIDTMTVDKATFTMDNKAIKVGSQNTLNNQPLNIDWTHLIKGRNPTAITDTLEITGTINPAKQTIGTVALSEFMAGTTDINVVMNRYRKTKNWQVTASADISKTNLKIQPLAWEKSKGTRGVASAKGIWTNTGALIVKNLKMRVMGTQTETNTQSQSLSFTGAGRYNLNTAKFDSFTITDLTSERFDLSAIYKKQNQKTYLKVKGNKADVDYITQNLAMLSSGEEKTAANVIIDLASVTAENRGTLHNLKVDWVKNTEYTEHFKSSFLQKTVLVKDPKTPSKPIIKTPKTGDKQKTIHPQAPQHPDKTVSVITMVPNGRAFDFHANIHDAGALFEFLDIDRGITGGQTIVKASRPGPFSTVTGTVKTGDYHLSDAPNFGRLLQVISLVDIFKALSDKGITFKRLESDFTWKGNVINFENGITNSSSVGFTFEGGLNTKTKMVALQGTAIPFYGLSKIVGSIPIVGTILTAGEGIYAVNYSVEGDMADPNITGNPLSALAPGILRKLFPSNADKSILKDDATPAKPAQEIKIKSDAPKDKKAPAPKDTKAKPTKPTVTPAPTAPVTAQ